MEKDELEKIAKMVANQSYAMSTPINFEQLIKDGLLKQFGKSYYVESIEKLPEYAKMKIKSIAKGRHGVKVTFYKESNSMKRLADKFRNLRD